LEKVGDIAHLDRVKFTDGQIGDQNVMIIARDFRDRARLPLALRDGDPDKVRQQLAGGQALISSVLVQKLGLKVGDTIDLGTDQGKKPFRICGTVNEYMVGGLAVYFDWNASRTGSTPRSRSRWPRSAGSTACCSTPRPTSAAASAA
jgi:hypothetical protein